MTAKLPTPTSLKKALSLDELFLPLEFKQHLLKSIIHPMEKSGILDELSGIIFGPPGTGKTTILKAVAKELDWQVIELGPHDLLRHPKPETAMIDYFSSITKYVKRKGIKKTIFVFDEIDEFVVSRDTGADRETRFATTMMLPLFQELRDLAEKTKNFIFFVLTNHIERFDPAIKRKGRFDLILPLGPPDYQARYLQFEKRIDELKQKYLTELNLIINTELSYEITYDLPINGEVIKQTEPIRRTYTDYDILARASERLSLADIRSMCKKVIEDKIGEEPSLRVNTKKKSSFIEIHTRRFIDWINLYRKTDPETQEEIDRFYRNAEIYSRGSLPYTRSFTVQEKSEQEFSSLIIHHNVNELAKKQWKVNQKKTLGFSFVNLSEFNGFSGSMKVIARIEGKDIAEEEIFQAFSRGQSSNVHTLDIEPKVKGDLELIFTIDGIFFLKGSETILEQNNATLKGITTEKRIIQIK